MSRGYPSMTALLALLAIAGYQNRDKIAEWVNAAQRKASGPTQVPEGGAASSLPRKLGACSRAPASGICWAMGFATWWIALNKPATVK